MVINSLPPWPESQRETRNARLGGKHLHLLSPVTGPWVKVNYRAQPPADGERARTCSIGGCGAVEWLKWELQSQVLTRRSGPH